ncbi:MAG: hypothetical protein KC434_10600, partial [Anaerolineales bacterium]|nr:hypothetical protein [Anaerolineales bacterium]
RTPSFIIATAYLARSAELLGQTAGILGKTDVQTHYLDLAQTVRAAFNQQYVTPAGWLLSDSATAYALALQFALLPDATQRQQAGQRLASVVRANGYRISTGFVGTPLICDALCSVGLVDVAYRLLLTRECPSWLYPVTMGATTIWERWDSLLPDGSVNPGKMTSFNHYALGAVADWMHRTIGGLAPAAAGYRHLTMQPQPGGGLTQASTRHQTPYGLASCAWEIEAGQITVAVEVPPNSTAEIILTGQTETVQVKAGKHRWQYAYEAAGGKRPFLTVDSLIGDLIDDPQAGPLAIAAIRQHGTELADQMFAQETLSVREAVSFLPKSDKIIASIAELLASLER